MSSLSLNFRSSVQLSIGEEDGEIQVPVSVFPVQNVNCYSDIYDNNAESH